MSQGSPSRIRRALDRLSASGWPPADSGAGARAVLHRVRTASTRVALITTAIVAVVYLVTAVSVVLIVTSRDSSSVDSDIDGTLSRAAAVISGSPAPELGSRLPMGGAEPASTQYIWVILPDGSQRLYIEGSALDSSVFSLPGAAQTVGSSPRTFSLNGADYRLVGTSCVLTTRTVDPMTGEITLAQTPLRVVVGQAMAAVEAAQSNIIVAESIVGPILLIAVFLGAMAIGRRVAAPIELARLRQLEFTADASHELRTPLSVIEAQTSLALSESRDPDWYRLAFQRVQGESGRMRRLVEDLLWLARFDSTRQRPEAEHVDLAILTQTTTDRFTAVAEAKRVRLSVHTAPVPLIVQAPPEWLDRLLGVLLDNACKYVPVGGTVDVSVWAEGNRVRLTVDDSGPGIPVEERPRIFDRFHRATDRGRGAGLGLAIANSVVKATGGRWAIAESPSGGASMGVIWPRSLAGDAATQEAWSPSG